MRERSTRYSQRMSCGGLAGDLPWLKGSERSFEFWENKEDAVYDSL